jgi:hypothetical protein
MRLAEPYHEFWARMVAPASGSLDYQHRIKAMMTTLNRLQSRVRLIGSGVRVRHAPIPKQQTRGGDSHAKR